MGKGKRSSIISKKALLKRLERLERDRRNSHDSRSRSRSHACSRRSVSSDRRRRSSSTSSRRALGSDTDRRRRRESISNDRRPSRRSRKASFENRPRRLDASRSTERDRVGRSPSVAAYSNTNVSHSADVLDIELEEGSILDVRTPHHSNRNSPDVRGGTPPLLINNDEVLDTEALKILGEDPKEKKGNNLTLHAAICSRWSHILSHNISEEDRKNLYDQYLIPENLPTLNAPEVNPEVLPHLSAYHRSRDEGYAALQKQLSHSLTALGTTLNVLLTEKDAIPENLRNKLLAPLWDSGRLQAALISKISLIRRTAIIQANNKQFKEIAEKTLPEKYLFGSDLGDKFKEAKALENMGKNLFSASSNSTGRSNKSNNSRRLAEKRGGGTGSHSENRQRPFRQWRETKPTKGSQYRPPKPPLRQQYNNSRRPGPRK